MVTLVSQTNSDNFLLYTAYHYMHSIGNTERYAVNKPAAQMKDARVSYSWGKQTFQQYTMSSEESVTSSARIVVPIALFLQNIQNYNTLLCTLIEN